MQTDAEVAVGMALPTGTTSTCLVYPDLDADLPTVCVDIAIQCPDREFFCTLTLNQGYVSSKKCFEQEIFRATIEAYRKEMYMIAVV